MMGARKSVLGACSVGDWVRIGGRVARVTRGYTTTETDYISGCPRVSGHCWVRWCGDSEPVILGLSTEVVILLNDGGDDE